MKTKSIVLTLCLTLIIINMVFAQQSIEGIVLNQEQKPICGVIVEKSNSAVGTRTDINGHFELLVDSFTEKLVFSFPGMVTAEVFLGSAIFIKVILTPEVPAKIKSEELASGPMIRFAGAQKSMLIASFPAQPIFDYNTEDYSSIHENGFKSALSAPLSTFSIDVDRAAYSNVRRFLNMGQLPPKDAVRVEEMINYFQYNYNEPTDGTPFNMVSEFTTCPWNENHQLVLIGLQSRKIETNNLPPSNLVFLIDVSGSMQAPNKLPLVQSSLKMLVNNLRPQDKVAIVVYAGSAGLVLESTSGSNKHKITDAIDGLKAGGSTAGGEGLKLAYKVASENFIKEGNNRIIIATDGDFNVGQTSDAEMERLVTKQRDHNIYLSVLGYGIGNLKDNKLETIADKGNGNYAYIDNSQEAQKVLIEEFGGTLFTVAKDVKIQIEFNPSQVKAYRLIGYENRILQNEDFNNDKKDAGELGAGQQVTVLYEIIPSSSNEEIVSTDELKYQKTKAPDKHAFSKEILTIKIRYKNPDSTESLLHTEVIDKSCQPINKASNNIMLAAAVAEFGMILRDSEYKAQATMASAVKLINDLNTTDNYGYRGELIRLMNVAESLGISNQPAF